MKVHRWTALALALSASAVVAGLAGAAPTANVKIAVVTDIGGLNDHSFNFLANTGRKQADKLPGVETRIWDTQSASDRLPNLTSAVRARYGLVFSTGSLFFDTVGKVAKAFPSTKFAAIDVAMEGVPENSGANLKNLRGLTFPEQEAGYLVGYVAGLTVKAQKGPDVVSAIGANPVPAIVRYLAGYKAGAKRAGLKPNQILVNYANDPTFSDRSKCKETALNQISRKSQVIFQVAGGCGFGALSAAKEKKVWGIGVDADASYLGSYILTSALKKVDLAILRTVKAYKKNPSGFKGGFDVVFNIKNGGLDFAPLSKTTPSRAAITKKAQALKRLIAAGKIKIPKK
jgi:basic membrane protein A